MFIGKIFLLIFVAHTKKIFSSNLPFLKFRVRSYQHKIQVIICFTNQKEKGFMKFSVDLNTNRLAGVLLVAQVIKVKSFDDLSDVFYQTGFLKFIGFLSYYLIIGWTCFAITQQA